MWVLAAAFSCSVDRHEATQIIKDPTGVPQADEEVLLSRRQVANRWSVCTETVKRKERAGLLSPVRFNQRLTRYRLSDVFALEQEATK
jgi:hypothetical protein